MNITNNNQPSFKAKFSQDITTQSLLKEGIQTNPYQVYEAHNFLAKIPSEDTISLSYTKSEDGTKYFIQLNNNAKVEFKQRIVSYKTPIVNLLKQLSYTIADGGEDFNKIFGNKFFALGDFLSNAQFSIDSFVSRDDINGYVKEISTLQGKNRDLKIELLKSTNDSNTILSMIEKNDLKIQKLKDLCFIKDKEFVSKALRIK